MYTNNYSIATGLQLIYRCNIDRLKKMKKSLPLEGDLKYVWQKIQKVIDPLHISNHEVFLKIIHEVFLFLKSIFQEARMQYFVPPF